MYPYKVKLNYFYEHLKVHSKVSLYNGLSKNTLHFHCVYFAKVAIVTVWGDSPHTDIQWSLGRSVWAQQHGRELRINDRYVISRVKHILVQLLLRYKDLVFVSVTSPLKTIKKKYLSNASLWSQKTLNESRLYISVYIVLQ